MEPQIRDFPDDYDMSARIKVEQSETAPIPATLWENALYYDADDIAEQLTSPGLYHAVIDQPLVDALIGLNFHFTVEPGGQIVAHGTAHPAHRVRSCIHTDTDTVLAHARILIHPREDETAEAIRRYINHNA